MTIELTEEQRQAVRNGDAVRVSAPDIGDVVVLSAVSFADLIEDEQDRRLHAAWIKAGQRGLAKLLKSDE